MPSLALEPLVVAGLGARLECCRNTAASIIRAASPEAVHELRVATRRLRTSLRLLEPVVRLPRSVRPQWLRELERRLGDVRDEDVFLARLEEKSAASEIGSDPALAPLIRTARRRRREQVALVVRRLERRKFRGTLQALAGWIRSPSLSPQAALPATAVIPDLIAPALRVVLLHPGWWVGPRPSLAPAPSQLLHHLRRRLKTLRYAVELFEPVYGERVSPWLGQWRDVQHGLGAFHDAGVALDRFKEAGAGPAARAACVAWATEALTDWAHWRDPYVDPARRGRLRNLLLCCDSSAIPGAKLPGDVAADPS
jgi:CHAD domain-containing protein